MDARRPDDSCAPNRAACGGASWMCLGATKMTSCVEATGTGDLVTSCDPVGTMRELCKYVIQIYVRLYYYIHPQLRRPGTQNVKRKVPHVYSNAQPLPKSRPHPKNCIYCPRLNASVWSGGPLCGNMFVFQKRNYGLLLDAFLSLLEMHLGIVCVQAIGLWGATGCVFLALEHAFGMLLCSMAFFCLCMRKFQKRI